MANTTNNAQKAEAFVAKGKAVRIIVNPIDGDAPSKTMSVQYGLFTVTKPGEVDKTSSRFEVTVIQVIDGREVPKMLRAMDAVKTCDRMVDEIYAAYSMDHDDFTIEADIDGGFENDYFKQRMVAAKPVETIWRGDTDGLEELNTLRSDVEAALSDVQVGEVATQDDRYKIGVLLLSAFESEIINKDRKRMASWAAGASGASNLPLLSQLGKGEHALTEAMMIAKISDSCRAALPFSISSGKGLKLHTLKAVGVLVDSSATIPVALDIVVNDEAFPGIAGIADMLRRVAVKSYGVIDAEAVSEGAHVMTLTDVVAAVNVSIDAFVADYDMNYGKHVNTYDKDSYAAALMHYGRVHCSSDGANVFGNAVASISALNEAEELDTGALAKLFNSHGNQLLRALLVKIRAYSKSVSDEKRNTALLASVENEEGPISATAAKGFAKLPALAAAAHLYKLLNTHNAAGDVLECFKSLVHQGDVSNIEKQKAA